MGPPRGAAASASDRVFTKEAMGRTFLAEIATWGVTDGLIYQHSIGAHVEKIDSMLPADDYVAFRVGAARFIARYLE